MMESVASSGGAIFVPSISIVEIIYLIEKGRMANEALTTLIEQLKLKESSFRGQELTTGIAETLTGIPRTTVPDMPDRIIAATALHLELPLITSDQNIRGLNNIKTIW